MNYLRIKKQFEMIENNVIMVIHYYGKIYIVHSAGKLIKLKGLIFKKNKIHVI